ncbi:MAG: hypothetical protein ABSB49_20145, partial [Polyangia bacterium]
MFARNRLGPGTGLLWLAVAGGGCFSKPSIDVSSLSCRGDQNCPAGYSCQGATATGLGRCGAIAGDGATGDRWQSTDGATSVTDATLAGGLAVDASGDQRGGPDLVSLPDRPDDVQLAALDAQIVDGAPDIVISTGGGGAGGTGGIVGSGGAIAPGGATASGGVGMGGSVRGGTIEPAGGVADSSPASGGLPGSGGVVGTGGGLSSGGLIASGGSPANGGAANTGGAGGASSLVASCDQPANPANGTVIAPALTVGSRATYQCFSGYNLAGNATITCQADGTWSAAAPSCTLVDCGPAPAAPSNGSVSAPTTTYGAAATYSCTTTGYSLSGSTTIT